MKSTGERTDVRIMGRNGLSVAFSMALCAMSISALGGRLVTETAEFSGSGMPAGWSAVDGGFLSPEYSNSVSRVALTYGPADRQFGEAQLFAIAHANGVETQIASVNAATAGAAFDFPAASDYRQFRISANGLSLASFSATWLDTRIDAPANIVATALTTDSLEVSWAAVNGASGYKVSVWTNVVTGASEGTESWSDDFSRAAASSGNPGALSSATFNSAYADMEGWECVSYVYPSTNSSAIRIGGADKDRGGVLISPPLPAGSADSASSGILSLLSDTTISAETLSASEAETVIPTEPVINDNESNKASSLVRCRLLIYSSPVVFPLLIPLIY